MVAHKGEEVAGTILIEAATSRHPDMIDGADDILFRAPPRESQATSTASENVNSDTKNDNESPIIRAILDEAAESSSSLSPSSSTSPTPAKKKKRAQYCTEEPWRSLMMSLIQILNGQSNVSFPAAVSNMKYIRRELFTHAVTLLEQYQKQENAE
ncbi:hypothetical protein BGZ50_002196 [Haplosporangium sp. Z 11]|nr:hypothetical protein BGZ50_002196 [Haplosporangium sp. Z 11]